MVIFILRLGKAIQVDDLATVVLHFDGVWSVWLRGFFCGWASGRRHSSWWDTEKLSTNLICFSNFVGRGGLVCVS